MTETKSLGLYSATSIGVGGMIGAGIFSIFGTAVKISGNAVYLSFIIAGLVALLNAYSYAKLGLDTRLLEDL
jgi:amino acid transporter